MHLVRYLGGLFLFTLSTAQYAHDHPLAKIIADSQILDLTVTVSENYPAHWPTHSRFERWAFNWYRPIQGPYSENPAGGKNHINTPLLSGGMPYYGQRMVIDEHTGTQADFPAHFVPPANSGLEFAAKEGWLTGDKYPLEHQMGPAVVIDVRHLRDKAANGISPKITLAEVKKHEQRYGEIQAGEVVVLYSAYSDHYYKPFPEGERFAYAPLILKSAPGWPAPTVELVEYLARKGVRHMATDGPSMGPVEGGRDVHLAFLKYGGSWTELTTGLGQLPVKGAYFISLSAKIIDMSGGLTRAIAIKPKGLKGVADD